MIEIKEVKTRKEKKDFVLFPINLYKDCPYYVPNLRADEYALFNPKKNVSYDDCDIVFYVAYKDGVPAGRICGIVQKVYNKMQNVKRVRFTRFDVIEDFEVAKKLLNAVENWAKEKGMDTVHGPLGFNDLDREGLLVEGFDELSTYESDYSYPYYAQFLEKLGYKKEVDWVEFQIKAITDVNDRIKRLAKAVKERYHLTVAKAKNKKEYINKYMAGIFETIDAAYGQLYGVIPYTEKLQQQIVSQFKLMISLDCMVTLLDKDGKVVAFGFGLPSLAKAVQKSRGKLDLFGIIRILHAVRHFKVFDFGLIAVRPEYQGKGLTGIIIQEMVEQLKKYNLEYCETNHSLETNQKIILTWKNFDDYRQHKRRRCYVKKL